MAKQVTKPSGGTIIRRGTSMTRKVVVVVVIFLAVGIWMDMYNNWHLLHILMGH